MLNMQLCLALRLCVLLLLIAAPGLHACPEHCRCVERETSTLTACVGHNLTDIPDGIPSSTEELYLKDLHIKVLHPMRFSTLTKLRTLIITHCDIERVEPNAFTGLRLLGTLDLRWNSIRELQSYTFSGLFHLKFLKLDNNELTVIHNLAFHGLNLTELSLEQNSELSEISPNAFHGSHVQKLFFFNSTISSKSLASLKPLSSSLRELNLKENRHPLVIREKLFKSFSFWTCNLNGNGIRDVAFLKHLTTDDLSLEGNPIGIIDFSRYPNLRQVRKLHLSHTGFWEVDGTYFQDMSHLTQLYLSHNGITMLPENIEHVFDRLHRLGLDGNALHCNCELAWFRRWLEITEVAVNGVTCSSPVSKPVLELEELSFQCVAPSLVSISRNLNVSETHAVSLMCFATGDPAPEIIWLHQDDESTSFPPSKNKTVLENTGVLKIQKTSEEDAGLYECFAMNVAGNISAIANLDVYRLIGSSSSSVNILRWLSLFFPLFLCLGLLYLFDG